MTDPPDCCTEASFSMNACTAPDASSRNACGHSSPIRAVSAFSFDPDPDTIRSSVMNVRDIAVPPASTFMPVEAIADA